MAASGSRKICVFGQSDGGFQVYIVRLCQFTGKQYQKSYVEKISVIGKDPLLVPLQKYTSECLPTVEACDILPYLVLETSLYTKDQFKNYRSLLAYNQMVSGIITSVLGQIIQFTQQKKTSGYTW